MGFEIPGPEGNASRGYRRRDAETFAFAPGEKPHDLDTERAVLAGLLLSTDTFAEVQNILKKEDFFLPAHHDIFESMQGLAMRNIPIDITTLAGALRDQAKLDTIGGAPYLTQIASIPVTSMHSLEYARIVADLSWRRRLLEAADMCRAAALKPGDTREIASDIEKRVFDATQERKSTSLVRVGDLLSDSIKELEKRADNRGITAHGVYTGLTQLDAMLNGFRPGQLVVLAAGPGTGKTSLSNNIMYDAATKHGKNILFFSLEMTREEVTERILSFASGIDAGKLRSGQLAPTDFNELFYAADEIGNAPMFVDDRSIITPFDVLATTRKLASTLKLRDPNATVDLVIVDYIQIMKSGARTENRALEVAAITGGLKAIAKEMRVPVLALSQLNRDRAKRTGADARPQLSDLKDSGAIEADADVVLFIHRDQGAETDSRAPAKAEIIVAKQRSGPTGVVPVTWLGHLTRFSNFVDDRAYGNNDFGPPPEFNDSTPDIGV